MPPSMLRVFRTIKLTRELEGMRDWLIDNGYQGTHVAYCRDRTLLAGKTFDELAQFVERFGYDLGSVALMYVD